MEYSREILGAGEGTRDVCMPDALHTLITTCDPHTMAASLCGRREEAHGGAGHEALT